MDKVLLIGMGGFLGAVSRYGLAGLVQRWFDGTFPGGTLAVNVLGCLIIGAVMSLLELRHVPGPEARLFLVIGFLGSFTTFSTVGFETFEFLRYGDYPMALVNAGLNLAVGVGAVALAWSIIKMIKA